jgi:hypothetical protein
MRKIIQDKIMRIYADTSVFGGVFDEEFCTASKVFFENVSKNRYKLITSELVHQEINVAPERVRRLFEEFLKIAEIAEMTEGVLRLQQAYLKAEIVAQKYATDAMHVALATVSKADLIVSWNFKHIVNFHKIPLYNAVNILNGFGEIAIYSPLEVSEYED